MKRAIVFASFDRRPASILGLLAVWLILLAVSFAPLSRGADMLTIKSASSQSAQLSLQGTANKGYLIETTGNLVTGTWSPLTTGATDSTGVWQPTDSLPGSGPRFYRASRLPNLVPTTAASSSFQDSNVVITLGASDPSGNGSALDYRIVAPPAVGALYQDNNGAPGPQITGSNVLVTDSQHRVIFVPNTNEVGAPYTTFTYQVTRVADGVTSDVQTVAVSINSGLATPTLSTVNATQETSLLFQVTATNPNPPVGGPLTFTIQYTATLGRLYQVGPDNVTPGAVVGFGATVTNANGWLMYVPPYGAYGTNFETFEYYVTNNYGYSALRSVYINIAHVNHAPAASDVVATGVNNGSTPNYAAGITLPGSDRDNDTLTTYFTSLPTQGTLYGPGNTLVVVGQGYPSQTTFAFYTVNDGSPTGAFSYGVPYATAAYYVEDPGGLISNTANITINVPYSNSPPIPSSPNVLVTPQTSDLYIAITGLDVDTPTTNARVFINTVPSHGTLIYRVSGTDFNVASQTLPVQLTGSTYPDANHQLIYRPDPNYLAGQAWSDSFTYHLSDPSNAGLVQTLSIYVNTTNGAPTIGGTQTSISIGPDPNGGLAQVGVLSGVTFGDDSVTANILSARIRVTLQAVDPKLLLSDGQGVVTADVSSYNGKLTLTRVSNAQIVLDGRAADINDLITRLHVTYQAPVASRTNPVRPAGWMRVTVDDRGWTNSTTVTPAVLSATQYLPMTYP